MALAAEGVVAVALVRDLGVCSYVSLSVCVYSTYCVRRHVLFYFAFRVTGVLHSKKNGYNRHDAMPCHDPGSCVERPLERTLDTARYHQGSRSTRD